MVLIGYIVQLVIIFLWYKLILTKELECKNIVRRSIRMFLEQRKNFFKAFWSWENICEEQKKAFGNIGNCLWSLFTETHLLIGYIILGPIVLKDIITYGDIGIIERLFYLALLCGLVLSRLKEDTQKIIEIINSYTRNIMKPLEKKPELLKTDDAKKYTIEWNIKKIVLILICSSAIIIYTILLEQIKNSVVVCIIAFILFVIMMVRKSNIMSPKNDIKIAEGIYVEGDILESIKDDIEKMCIILEIKTLECNIVADQDIYVESQINERSIPQIDISHGFISRIYRKDAKNILLMTVAHELGHIYYDDFSNIRKRVRRSNFVCLMLMLLNVLGLMATMISPIFLTITLLAMGIENIFGKVMCDVRFWGQIAEFRADRLAITVCEGDKMAFVEFWKEYSKDQCSTKTNAIDQFYRKYIKVEAHPIMERKWNCLKKDKNGVGGNTLSMH